MENKIIITADMVASEQKSQVLLESRMRTLAKEIEAKIFRKKKTFEFFRGDSFQATLTKPNEALRVALLWRSGIMATDENQIWDMRIGIGIGNITYQAKTNASSVGTAYQYSGLLLDELKKNDQMRLGIKTFSEEWNQQLETECLMADALLRRWTAVSAQAVYYQLLHNETQEQLAQRLGIAQPAVHKRLQTANWNVIKVWEKFVRSQIEKKLTV